jgi:hypothetical protein
MVPAATAPDPLFLSDCSVQRSVTYCAFFPRINDNPLSLSPVQDVRVQALKGKPLR